MVKISYSFLQSMASLPTEKLRKIPKCLRMLQERPSSSSLKLEALAGELGYSIRLDLAYRIILVRKSDHFLVLSVGKHDEAYRSPDSKFPYVDQSVFGLENFTVEPECPPSVSKTEGKTKQAKSFKVKKLTLKEAFQFGGKYQLNELKEYFDWDETKRGYYLRERDGRILCACLRRDMNPEAPWEILVGKSPSNIRQAELLAGQSSPIPIFISNIENQWEYWGQFRFDQYDDRPETIRVLAPADRIDEIGRVMYLNGVD